MGAPTGIAPGIDVNHPASGAIQFSAICLNQNFINLMTGFSGVFSGTGGTSAQTTLAPIGQCYGNAAQGGTYVNTHSGVATPVAATRFSAAAIIQTPSTFATSAQAIVSQGANNADAGGFYLRISQTTGTIMATCPAGTSAPVSSFSLLASTPYFIACSSSPVAAGNVTNYIAVNLLTGQVSTSATTGSTTVIGVGGTATVLAQSGRGFSGYIAACMTNTRFMSMAELITWANDPWIFWYPKGRDK